MIIVHYEKYGLEEFKQGARIFGSMKELKETFPWPKYGLVEKPLSGMACALYMTEKATKKKGG